MSAGEFLVGLSSNPVVAAALVAGSVSLVVALISSFITLRVAAARGRIDEKITKLKGEMDSDLARTKGELDAQLAEQKVRLDNKVVFAAERVAHELMMDEGWKWRSFRVIKHHLGGFEDDELRKILVRAGAIRSKAADDQELWGLLDRNRDSIGVEQLNQSPG
ncbi:hypothetical protein [Rhizobium beringeri]|uniref:hypothetical protein n=1 Tax=Rhizobium beringeri TaxID=3019934 RepID=UPI003B5CB6D0